MTLHEFCNSVFIILKRMLKGSEDKYFQNFKEITKITKPRIVWTDAHRSVTLKRSPHIASGKFINVSV
jgi:hypothetical protein